MPPLLELNRAGRPVLRYLPEPGDPPTAGRAEPLGDQHDVVAAVLEELAGWLFLTNDDALTDALLAAGCGMNRQGALYSRDLVADPPDPSWRTERIGSFESEPLDLPAAALTPVSLAAYPPGHPDAETQDPVKVEMDIDGLLTGSVVGPLMDVSTVVRDKERDSDPVVAMAIINRMHGASPTGGPWVSEICRDPDRRYAGLGASVLRRVMVQLADDGESSLSLVVTEGNPARQLYERLGFRYIKSFRKLSIPALARDSAS
jgi:ribosomal protein S18 acetylase RimI-like enzyme